MEDLPGHFSNAAQDASRAGRYAASGSWAKSTLKGYSAGIAKFLEFKEKTGAVFNQDKPIPDKDIYDFIAWAGEEKGKSGKPLSAVTVKKYLDGIRAWHIVRHTSIPSTDPAIVKTYNKLSQETKQTNSSERSAW